MEPTFLNIELILCDSSVSLGEIQLDWRPEAGAYLEWQGQTYIVLERRHRYILRGSQYHLHKAALYVKKTQKTVEKSLLNGRWVLGDATCMYNAHSELIRCAVNPKGPCENCDAYQPQP
ncbi:MAG TPA: DUF6464 family protein [Stenomitos sp.]